MSITLNFHYVICRKLHAILYDYVFRLRKVHRVKTAKSNEVY